MCGLLRSGALKVEDRPVWFDVFEAFPPKTVPVYEQKVPRKKVQNILYPEDFIRVYKELYSFHRLPTFVLITMS